MTRTISTTRSIAFAAVATATLALSVSAGSVSNIGGPCGGLIMNAPTCAPGLVCQFGPVPDLGGKCIAAPQSTNIPIAPITSTVAPTTTITITTASTSAAASPTTTPKSGATPVMGIHNSFVIIAITGFVASAVLSL